MTINNWYWGGAYENSGIRTDYGGKFSAHRFGKALDLKFRDAEIEEVFDFIMQNEDLFYEIGIRRIENIEDTPTWLHVDTIDSKEYDGIYVFKP